MKNNNGLISDYEQLLSELNAKYFEKVCDIFDSSKTELLKNVKEILGEEYDKIEKEIASLKSLALEKRKTFDEEPYMIDLKEKLETAKIEFVEAKDDAVRTEKKKVLNNVLSEIASRNLKVFAEMAEIRKQMDAKRVVLADIVKSKESEYKTLEKEIVSKARAKTVELTVSYESETCALAYAFDVKTYSKTMPFLSFFDPNMKLMDFDKQAFMDAFNGKSQACGMGCSGKCSSCTPASLEQKNYFNSESKDEFKN